MKIQNLLTPKKIISILILITFLSLSIKEFIIFFMKDDTCIKVQNETITKKKYDNYLDNTVKYLNQIGTDLKEQDMIYIHKVTIDNLILNSLFSYYIEKYMISISNNLIIDEIKKSDSFKNENGKFSTKKLDEVLKSNNYTEKKYINELKNKIQKMLFIYPLTTLKFNFNKVSEKIYNYYNDIFTIDIYSVNLDQIKDNIGEPDEDSLMAFYKENKTNYKTDNSSMVKYIVIDENSINNDNVKISDEEIDDVIKNNNYDKKYTLRYFTVKNKDVAQNIVNAINIKDARTLQKIMKEEKIELINLRSIKINNPSLNDFIFNYLNNYEFNEENKRKEYAVLLYDENEKLYYIFHNPQISFIDYTKLQKNVYPEVKKQILKSKINYEKETKKLVNEIENLINKDQITFHQINSKYPVKMYSIGNINTDNYHHNENYKKLQQNDNIFNDDIFIEIAQAKLENTNFFIKSNKKENTYYTIYISENINQKQMSFNEAKPLIIDEIKKIELKQQSKNILKDKKVKTEKISRIMMTEENNKILNDYPIEFIREIFKTKKGKSTKPYFFEDKMITGKINSISRKKQNKNILENILEYNDNLNLYLLKTMEKEMGISMYKKNKKNIKVNLENLHTL